ncbi:hypothetical protein OVA11_02805 [Caulobacter sp. SL161]|uniref:hypothetical protein n=1 Tax=Caulobacter sp. SL161 TaxID=2995156 RepID=UPI0022739173|nr:hypothetical protein [Caulobacter sp. SL161]MCY1646028.1 hypothetical protein [Caulobacter sp. SL161]
MKLKVALKLGVLALSISLASALAGCFVGDENTWADRQQIIDAAARCGLKDFAPTKVGDAWAAYVDQGVEGQKTKEDCIYSDLQKQGLLVTR